MLVSLHRNYDHPTQRYLDYEIQLGGEVNILENVYRPVGVIETELIRSQYLCNDLRYHVYIKRGDRWILVDNKELNIVEVNDAPKKPSFVLYELMKDVDYV